MTSTLVLKLAFAVIFVTSPLFASVNCPAPSGIKDFVACQNQVLAATPGAKLSDYLSAIKSEARIACSRSGASAQPAFPDQGDLRCFFIFPSQATLSFNLVDGMNDNHIEVSEAVKSDLDEDGVLLAFFLMNRPVDYAEALASSSAPLNDRGLKCSFCHEVLGNNQIERDGVGVWVLAPIKLNSSVRQTVPRNGQISPESLDRVIDDLIVKHRCSERLSMGSETCTRLKITRSIKEKHPLDNP